MEAGVAYYQTTGKDKLLHVVERLADHIISMFGEDKEPGIPGHQEVEIGLMKLYRATGKEKYKDMARYFLEERGKNPNYFYEEKKKRGWQHWGQYSLEPLDQRYTQTHATIYEQKEAVGHSVRAVYMYTAMADLAGEDKDQRLYEACQTLWDNIVKKRMYITGGIGSTVEGEAFTIDYDLPNDMAYAETCASIGMIFFAKRMLEIKPLGIYADIMEREFYNGTISGIQLDGKQFFYVNPLEVNPGTSGTIFGYKHVLPTRPGWYACACCPPNLARLVSSIGSYAYTEKEDTLFVHLYMGSELTKKVGDKDANVAITSELPWDGNVEIAVEAKDTDFVLALRIPDWCGGNYTVDGIEKDEMSEKDGYLYVKKAWSEKDVLKLHFSMPLLLMEADEKVREDAGKVAVLRGPIVYCLEEVDNGKDLHLLEVNPDGRYEIRDSEICGNQVKVVEMDGFRVVDTAKKAGELYHVYKRKEKEAVELKFVPYYTWANRGENEMEVWIRI